MESTPQLTNPPLYTARVIRVFALLFSPIAGGVLAAQNLKDVGHAGPARKALWFSIAGTLLLLTIAYFLPEPISNNTGLRVGANIGAGFALTAYAEKLIPNKEAYPAKSVVKPLVICLVIFLPILALMLYPLLS